MEFVNGVFIGVLWDKIQEHSINLEEALDNIPVLAVRLGSKAGKYKNTHLHKTAPESIFLGEKCSFVDPEIIVFPIHKTGRNHFPNSVTFGRALVSDMCITSPKISKLHGWFSRDMRSGNWTVTDHYSTNGTWVNGNKLSPGMGNPLRPNDELQIGDARALYLDYVHLEALLSLYETEYRESKTV